MAHDLVLVERMERPPVPGPLRVLPWLLIAVGFVAIVGLGLHGYTAFATVARAFSFA